MLSTMQDVPLTVSRILSHGELAHATSKVITWTGDADAPQVRTFAQIGARAAQLAHALRDELGVRGDARIGTLMWNNSSHLECYLAIPSMGAVLHTLNLRLPVEQLIWIVNHAADDVIVIDGSLIPLLAPILPALGSVRHVVVSGPGDRSALTGGDHRAAVHDYDELIAGRPERYDWAEPDEREAAALCYTSGTTGDPKGVLFSHRSVYLHALQVNTAEASGMTAEDIALPIVPMFHVNAWGWPHAAFMSGGSLLMPDRFLQAAPIADMIEKVRPTIAAAVPTIWQGLLAELDARPRDVSSLREVVIGGSACPPSLMRAFEERHGIRLVHAWGMTETSPIGSVAKPPPTVVGGVPTGVTEEEVWAYRVSQGRLLPAVEVRLTGPEGEFLPWDGESAGEVEIRGPWVASAYYGGADNAEPLRPEDKFSPDGWLRTGDVGTMSPNGYLTLTDRAKDVIKSGGEWISSVELENRLMAHPAVSEAAVIAVPDEKWGERPLAGVVLAEGSEVSYEELRSFLGERVARWQLPERWAQLVEVPKTSVGKFDKKLLRARYASGELDVTTL